MSRSAPLAGTPLWRVRSDLPGRLRLICEALVTSPLLRHHCSMTLTGCHWLQGFRINNLQGSVVVRFPPHRRGDLIELLQDALRLPTIEDDLAAPLALRRTAQWRPNPARQLAIRHGTACALVLLAELVLPLPVVVMTGAALLALVPLVKEVWQVRRHRHLVPAEALELAFSGVLVSRGLAGEALLDLVISDASEALRSLLTDEDAFHPESLQWVDRLGRLVTLERVNSNEASCPLGEARCGDRYRLNTHAHVFLESRVVEGELVVLNRLVDGDWRPRQLSPGDTIHPGALLIKGQAVLEVLQELNTHPSYQVPLAIEASKHHITRVEERLEVTNRFLTPVLLGLGGLWFALGAVERALGLLQFNPLHDWQASNLSSRMTAMASLRWHGIRLNDPDALPALGTLKHVVISRGCLDQMGSIETREHLDPGSGWQKGDLVRLLAGLQRHLLDDLDLAIWSQQWQHVRDPLEIAHVEIQDLHAGWTIELADGRRIVLKEQPQAANDICLSHLNPLELWENNTLIGSVELISEPSEVWVGVCEALEELGLTVHLVGRESYERMLALAPLLGMQHLEHLYPHFHAEDRLELVRNLQRQGDGVAYLGYVVDDLPALSQADVSIGIEVDADSVFTAGICDVVIGADAHWLPRMIQMSRRLDSTANSNFALIGSSSLLTAIAASAAWINPVSTVLLADLPLLLAELRNITALTSHGVYETHSRRTRLGAPLVTRHHASTG